MEHLWRDDGQTNKNENGVNTLVSIWSLHFLFRSQYNDINIQGYLVFGILVVFYHKR